MSASIGTDAKLDAPAYHRNIEPISAVFRDLLASRSGHALEVGCGSGQHAATFAGTFPDFEWWPGDPDPTRAASATAWGQAAGNINLHPGFVFDALTPSWPLGGAGQAPENVDLIYNFNVIHIAPWPVAEAIIGGAGRHLSPEGLLVFYGPFKLDGRHTAESNLRFDESLRGQDASWGIRDLGDVINVAERNGLRLMDRVTMPANNFTVVFAREDTGDA